MAHLRGIPAYLRERHGVPVIFYDGDAPMSLPEFGGMDTGFNWYHESDPSRVRPPRLQLRRRAPSGCCELGARRAEPIFWGADPEFFAPQRGREVDATSSSTATATSSGASGCRRWSASRRARCPTPTSRSADATSRATSGRARQIGDVPFNTFARAISAARINLCITRRSHASVYASSSCRPFELASAGAAIVSNPYNGIERWFEPGSELIVVDDAEQATNAYRELLADPAQAEELGRRARERVLDEHTYRHRARQLLALLGLGGPSREARCRLSRCGPDRDRARAERGAGHRAA